MSGITILLVEDDPQVKGLIRDLLESEGWCVETEQNGVSALQRLQRAEHYDVIVTGNQMPGMDGLAFIQCVRNLGVYKATPIIMISGEPCEVAARRVGADAFLRKPEDIMAIPIAVGSLIGTERKNVPSSNFIN